MDISRFDKIAVVGAGAVGSYYGARLARTREVAFLMRRDLEAVRRRGLRVESCDGDFRLDPVACYGSTGEIGPVDLVLIALKTTANAELPRLLPPLLREGTVLLTLQNGLGNEEFLASRFPGHAVLGGLCFVCINRGEPGVIRHSAHGRIELGGHGPGAPLREVAALLGGAGIDCRVLPDLGLARWRKLVWNVPFNGLSIAAGGIDVARILADPVLLERARRLMAEIIAAAAARGHAIDSAFAGENIARTREMGAYRPSSLVDHLAGRAVELEAIWGEPLRLAEEAGCAVPELKRLYLEIRERLPPLSGSSAR